MIESLNHLLFRVSSCCIGFIYERMCIKLLYNDVVARVEGRAHTGTGRKKVKMGDRKRGRQRGEDPGSELRSGKFMSFSHCQELCQQAS